MVDLEKFPTSPTAKRMIKTVSPVYDRAYVGKWIFQVMGLEMDEAWKFLEELRLQAFPETATWGIVYWEQRYHIPPDDSLTIEERRQRVIVKRGKRSPMNPARVELIIGDMIGMDVKIIENVAPYTFRVAIEDVGGAGIDTSAVYAVIRQIKPSHQGFELEINAKAREKQLSVQTGLMNVAVTELPEWAMDYNYNAGIGPFGTIISIGQTTLPPIEQ